MIEMRTGFTDDDDDDDDRRIAGILYDVDCRVTISKKSCSCIESTV